MIDMRSGSRDYQHQAGRAVRFLCTVLKAHQWSRPCRGQHQQKTAMLHRQRQGTFRLPPYRALKQVVPVRGLPCVYHHVPFSSPHLHLRAQLRR